MGMRPLGGMRGRSGLSGVLNFSAVGGLFPLMMGMLRLGRSGMVELL